MSVSRYLDLVESLLKWVKLSISVGAGNVSHLPKGITSVGWELPPFSEPDLGHDFPFCLKNVLNNYIRMVS